MPKNQIDKASPAVGEVLNWQDQWRKYHLANVNLHADKDVGEVAKKVAKPIRGYCWLYADDKNKHSFHLKST